MWYYEIGGAQVVPKPLNPSKRSLAIAGSAQLGLGYSCGNFDPVLGVAETLNQVKSGAEDMLRAMTQAATGAIASLPALILQRANPGLYELMQNALVGAKLKVDLATKDCRQMEADIAQGKNPYHELIVLSKGNDWKRQMSIGGNNAVHAQQQVEAANGANGVPWVLGQSAGGQGQSPLRLTGDIVQAGYNIALNRNAANTAPAPTSVAGRIRYVWPTPLVAATWVTEVVGEHKVTTCANCPKLSTPGQGLLPSLTRESEELTSKLDSLLLSHTSPTRDALAELSGPNIALTREVIEALVELPQGEQAVVKARLVNDIAVSRTLEKAFYARRLLITGGQIPEALSSATATNHVTQAITTLDAETERLLFEYRARQAVVSDTVQRLMKRATGIREASRGIPELGPIDTRPMLDGRVQR
ncbi:MAG: integrating conjugative element protein [Gammaproteobacteria bacterium]|nr:integrating conjugative element protein [Gammaproteobacteria bacterium]